MASPGIGRSGSACNVMSGTHGLNTSVLTLEGAKSQSSPDLYDNLDSPRSSSATKKSRKAIEKEQANWEENSATCSVCENRFGWWRGRRWHHCRLCGRCVCSKCSPSFLCMERGEKPVRVCTPCIAEAPKVAALATRVADLTQRVAGFFGSPTASCAASSADLGLLLKECEEAMEPIERARGKGCLEGLPSLAGAWTAINSEAVSSGAEDISSFKCVFDKDRMSNANF